MGTLMMRDLGLSKSVMLAGVSLTLLTSGLAGPLVGRFKDRPCSRVLMALGSVLWSLGVQVFAIATGSVP